MMMNLKDKAILGVLFAIVSLNVSSSLNAANVISNKKREASLATGEKLLQQADEALLESFTDIQFPFEFEKEVIPEPVIVQTDEGPKVVEAPVVKKIEIPDSKILTGIINSAGFKPKGFMERNGRKIVLLPKSQLSLGQKFKIKAPDGKPRIIVVDEITSEYYVLRLNKERITKYFNESASSGKIQRDSVTDTIKETEEDK